jgi:hypothetical protein
VLRPALESRGVAFTEGTVCDLLRLRGRSNVWFLLHGHEPNLQKIYSQFARPRGKISHIIRDPRDVAVSGYFYHKVRARAVEALKRTSMRF